MHGKWVPNVDKPPGMVGGQRGRWLHHGMVWLAVGCLLPACALAETSDSFEVTVSGKSQAIVILGASTIDSGTMQRRALQRAIRVAKPNRGRLPTITNITAIGVPGFAALLTAAAAASSDLAEDFGRWSVFANVNYRFGEHEGSTNTPAYDFDRLGGLLGVDYRVNPDLFLGASAGYQGSEAELTETAGGAELASWSLSAFGSWYPMASWYIDGIARVALNEYEMLRLTSSGDASGSTKGVEYSWSVSSGYIFSDGALTLTPSLALNYSYARIESFVEEATANALVYEEQEVESFRAEVGGTATYAITTEFGVLQPQASFEWVHEFLGESRQIMARPVAGGPAFSIPVDARDDNFFRAALGATAILPRGRLVYIYYAAQLARQNKDVHTITLGVRLEF